MTSSQETIPAGKYCIYNVDDIHEVMLYYIYNVEI